MLANPFQEVEKSLLVSLIVLPGSICPEAMTEEDIIDHVDFEGWASKSCHLL